MYFVHINLEVFNVFSQVHLGGQLIFADLKYESATISLSQLQKKSSNLNEKENFTFSLKKHIVNYEDPSNWVKIK